jgi:hypothetical protein
MVLGARRRLFLRQSSSGPQTGKLFTGRMLFRVFVEGHRFCHISAIPHISLLWLRLLWSAVRAGIDAITEDLVQRRGALRTTNRPFVMPPADVSGFALGITTDYGIKQVVDFWLGGEDSHSGMLGSFPIPSEA